MQSNIPGLQKVTHFGSKKTYTEPNRRDTVNLVNLLPEVKHQHYRFVMGN